MSTDNLQVNNRPRLAKRKEATRLRLLKAAYGLMAKRGQTDVAIQEITCAADVGFGTFYNYFPSKDAIYEAVVEEVLEGSGAVVDKATAHLQDPAERLSAGVQYTLLQAQDDPLWGSFLSSSIARLEAPTKGLGKFLMRDINQGLDQRRFQSADFMMTLIAIIGTIDMVLRTMHKARKLNSDELEVQDWAKRISDDIPRRTAAQILFMLGMSQKESQSLADKPLPPMEGFAKFLE